MKKYWFVAKTYGWGWTPATWQGWVIVLMYLILMYGGAWGIFHFVSEEKQLRAFLPFVGVISSILLYLSYKKGERPRWQWGNRTKKND